jgi:tetratricopeptide (TPR) repeat protein
MPVRVWMNVRFHTASDQYVPVAHRSDHRIAIHPEATQAVLLAWYRTQTDAASRAEADRLAAQLGQYWLNEATRRQRDARLLGTIGALREALKADPSPLVRQRLQEAIARHTEFERLLGLTKSAQGNADETIPLLKKILQIKPDHAFAHGELGQIYIAQGLRFAGEDELKEAARCDPEDSFSRITLAQLAYLDGRWDAAVALFAAVAEIEPYDANIHHGWGLALEKMGRPEEAALHFQRALAIDPGHVAANVSLNTLLLKKEEVEEALLHARRAVRWTHAQNATALLTLADAYTAARRPADARKTLQQALQAAQTTSPHLLPTINSRLSVLRDKK